MTSNLRQAPAWETHPQTPADFTTIHVSAYTQTDGIQVRFDAYFETKDQAAEVVASFPKGCKVHASTLNAQTRQYGTLSLLIDLRSTGVTGSKNETGLRRFAQMMKAVEAKGLEIDWRTGYTNSVLTLEDLLEAVR